MRAGVEEQERVRRELLPLLSDAAARDSNRTYHHSCSTLLRNKGNQAPKLRTQQQMVSQICSAVGKNVRCDSEQALLPVVALPLATDDHSHRSALPGVELCSACGPYQYLLR